MLSIGLVGLPNVGKSTLFNALTSGQAQVSNYPFTTIDPHVGAVAVPDERLQKLGDLLRPQESTPCFVQFIDIAGLVQGASRGEGLGNQFLANIRQVDAVVHVIRCFEEPEAAHVFGQLDPLRDVEVVETELLLADLEGMNRLLEKKERVWKANPREAGKERERLEFFRRKLEEGIPLRTLDLDGEARQELKGLALLTAKPVLYAANVSEEDYREDHPAVQALKEKLGQPAHVIAVSARIEWEIQQLAEPERPEFMQALGIKASGLQRLVRQAYTLLELITFYTVVHEKLRAWEVASGTRAPQAAGKIHSDMERNFIRAQVVSFDALCEHGGMQELHRLGQVRTEGKEYEVRDGDVIEFLFSHGP